MRARLIRFNHKENTWEVLHPKFGWLPCSVEQARQFFDYGYRVVL